MIVEASAATGELALTIERRELPGRSIVASQRHRGALRVLRPHYPDGSRQPVLMVVNPGGGYLGGDRYELDVRLGPGAELLLTTQAATKVYRAAKGSTLSEQRFVLERGARLEVVPDSLIAYEGARYRQSTEVSMHPEASLVLSEVVTHGWSPHGTPFVFEEVSLQSRVRCEGRPLVTDRLVLRPASGGTARLMIGGFSHLATLLVVDPRVTAEAIRELRAAVGATEHPIDGAEALTGLTELQRPGFVLRALAHSTPAAERILHLAIDWMRERWHAQSPLPLRKP